MPGRRSLATRWFLQIEFAINLVRKISGDTSTCRMRNVDVRGVSCGRNIAIWTTLGREGDSRLGLRGNPIVCDRVDRPARGETGSRYTDIAYILSTRYSTVPKVQYR